MARFPTTKDTTQEDPKTTILEDNTAPLNVNAPTTILQLNDARKITNADLVVKITEVLEEEETKPSPPEITTSNKKSTTILSDKAMPEKTPQWNPDHPCIEAVQAAILNMKITPKPKWGSAAATKGYEIKGLVKGKWGYKKLAKKQRPTSK
jgi:hypothetical protein